ncbi:hypothetical protein PYCC9005_000555 [Savitreella phatthalungensis]
MDYAQIGLDRPHTPANEPIRTRFRKPNGRIKERTAVFIVCVTAMSLFGYDQGLLGGVLVGDQFIKHFEDPSPSTQGFVTSIYDIGCFVGCIVCLFIGDLLGRRRTIMAGVSIMAGGAILQTLSADVAQLAWGRFIAGIGNGLNTATAPVYHAEVSEAHDRGKAVVMEMFINVVGFVISNWTTLAFAAVPNNMQWRIPFAGQLVFAGIIAIALPFAPESPRWLMIKGRQQEGLEVIAQLDGMDISSERVQVEGRKIAESIEVERRSQVSWFDLLRRGQDENSTVWRAFLGVALQAMQQVSGINVVAYFLPLVLQKSVGLRRPWPRVVAAFNSITFCLANLVPYFLIERCGRRVLLIVLAVTNGLCFLVAAIALSTISANNTNQHTMGIIATIAFMLFFISFGCGWCAIPWLYPAEINSIGMRTKGAALASASDWLFNYVVVGVTPLGIHHLGWRFYLIFFVLNVSFAPIVYLFFPETAGKSLEEIDAMFSGGKASYLVVGKAAAIRQARGLTGVAANDRDIEEVSLIRANTEHDITGDAFALGDESDDDRVIFDQDGLSDDEDVDRVSRSPARMIDRGELDLSEKEQDTFTSSSAASSRPTSKRG